MKRILVTGASGFIGRYLCAQLKQRGMYVRILSRRQLRGDWDECCVADLATDDLPDNLLHGIDTIFHLAGYAHAMASETDQRHWHTTVTGTEKLLALLDNSNVERIVYLSSIKAMGDPHNDCVDESFTLAPRDSYGRARQTAEQHILASAARHRLHACVLRPCLVYGNGVKGNLRAMVVAVRKGWFPPLAETNNRRSMVSVDDLVAAMLLVAENRRADGKIYIVADNEHYSTRRIYNIILAQLGKQSPRWNFPISWLKLLASVGDLLYRFLRIRLPLNSEIRQRLLGSACYSSVKLQKELGWQPTQTLADVDICG